MSEKTKRDDYKMKIKRLHQSKRRRKEKNNQGGGGGRAYKTLSASTKSNPPFLRREKKKKGGIRGPEPWNEVNSRGGESVGEGKNLKARGLSPIEDLWELTRIRGNAKQKVVPNNRKREVYNSGRGFQRDKR